MTPAQIAPLHPKPLRLWPGWIAAGLALSGIAVSLLSPAAMLYGLLGEVASALIIVLWWAFFSRAPWPDRLIGIAAMAAAVFAIHRFLHPSIANAGMGMLYYFYAVPAASLGLVAGVAASRSLTSGSRRAATVVAILLACGALTLVRTEGVTGGGAVQLAWRWQPTPEQMLLASAKEEPVVAPAAQSTAPPSAPAGDRSASPAAPPVSGQPAVPASGAQPAAIASAPAAGVPAAEWPGFRGPLRDGIVRGLQIQTDWSASPPAELWRRPVGPGWSSFAVHGDLLYTQEQRGDDELVACYKLFTGQPVWQHRDAARFWESNGGAGPRGTPTLSGGRVYTLGATGILNALDAATGAALWSRNVSSDAEAEVPYWGFASSPLVVGDALIVAASGRLVAYDLATGKPRWLGPKAGGGYSSPQLLTMDGVPQVVLLSGAGATSVAPADGTVLWQHRWPGGAMLQPALTAEGDLLVTTSDMSGGVGTRRIAVARASDQSSVTERWTSRGLKPYFNDLVVHQGYAYGFDGGILACLDLADGNRKWKGGRYGHGQLLLLPDQDLLLVLSEEGELALVSATPDQFSELARLPAIEGKTWNHPVLVGDVLLVRNDREMAAFRLPRAGH